MDSVLAILKQKGHSDLPGSACALLNTERNVSVQMKSVHKKVSEIEVDEHIAEYLRHVPSKPGGTTHKVLNEPILENKMRGVLC